jgi:hypothetical protein
MNDDDDECLGTKVCRTCRFDNSNFEDRTGYDIEWKSGRLLCTPAPSIDLSMLL